MTPRSRKKKDGITPETSRRPKEEMEEARRVLEESSEENPNQENPTSQPADSSTTRPPATAVAERGGGGFFQPHLEGFGPAAEAQLTEGGLELGHKVDGGLRVSVMATPSGRKAAGADKLRGC